jgi:FkbM family methyltransferase
MTSIGLFAPNTRVEIMDVGAAAIAEVPSYKPLLDLGIGHLHAFEGDQRQIDAILAAYSPHVSIHGDFLFDGTKQTLYLASGPSGMTSLLKPKIDALRFFNGFEQFGHVERTEQVATRKLDEVADLPPIELLKMDIQGAELTVMHHGQQKLAQCLAVQLEVSHICLYENQPTFGDVDVWMRAQGYVPNCFLDNKRWSIAPTIFGGNFRVPGNQLLESDIVYIKDPLNLSALEDEPLKKLATIAHACFKSYDLCAHLLMELERRGALSEGTRVRYYESLR